MARQIVEDHNGKTLGYIEKFSDGREEFRTSSGVLKGIYTSVDNVTRESATRRIIGKGNMLMTLIK